jgi:8-oxo-dGTP diphosphatase
MEIVHKNKTLTKRSLFPVTVELFVMRDGKLLLGKRKDPTYHDGEWGLPSGHLEEGEYMMPALTRELKEETGLSVTDFTFEHVINDVREDGYHYVHIGFVAKAVVGDPEVMEPDACYEWRWCDLANLPDPIFIGHRKSIQAFIHKKVFTE